MRDSRGESCSEREHSHRHRLPARKSQVAATPPPSNQPFKYETADLQRADFSHSPLRRPASAVRSQPPIGGQVPSFPELLPRCPRVGKTTPPLHACWPMLPSVKSKPIRHAPAEDFKLQYIHASHPAIHIMSRTSTISSVQPSQKLSIQPTRQLQNTRRTIHAT